MGQCSTLPESRAASTSTKHHHGGDNMMKYRDGYHGFSDKTPKNAQQAKRNGYLQVTVPQNGASPVASPPPFNEFSQMHMEKIQPQSRQPEQPKPKAKPPPPTPEPMQEELRAEPAAPPPPPESAKRARCYKLNLDPDPAALTSVSGQTQQICFGPFAEPPPHLTYSASDDSSTNMNTTSVAIQTAQIFRGITVGKDGTILSQNARATRSSRGSKTKRGEKSRQATKIDKAKDLVEEAVASKSPNSDDPANMVSLVIMGQYDDMKQLVRDGSKKLRDAASLPDEALLAINRPRGGGNAATGSDGGSSARRSHANVSAPPSSSLTATILSPRKRVSPMHASSTSGQASNSGSYQTPRKSRPAGLPQSAPPKLKSHPRDNRPSTRRVSEDHGGRSRGGGFAPLKDTGPSEPSHDNRQSTAGNNNGGADSDWSNFSRFQFQSIWNCGGTGDEISPTHVCSPKDKSSTGVGGAGATPAKQEPVFEGRDTNHSRAREGGVSSRAN